MTDEEEAPKPKRPGAVPAPVGVTNPLYHCPNCKFIELAGDPDGGFWACQNLCVRR